MTISFSNARNRRGEKGKKGQETRFFFSFLTNDSFFGIKKRKFCFSLTGLIVTIQYSIRQVQ